MLTVAAIAIVEPDNPKKVLVKKLVLVSEGQEDKVLDLSGDLSKLKQTIFVIKEGVQYRIRIEFFVQHEIVTGLKYVQKTFRKGIQGMLLKAYSTFTGVVFLDIHVHNR